MRARMIVCDPLGHATHVNRCDELHVEFMNRYRHVGWAAGLNNQVFETRDFSVPGEPEVAAASVTCVTLRRQGGVESLYNSRKAPARESKGIAAYLGLAQRLARYLHSFRTGTVTNFEFTRLR